MSQPNTFTSWDQGATKGKLNKQRLTGGHRIRPKAVEWELAKFQDVCGKLPILLPKWAGLCCTIVLYATVCTKGRCGPSPILPLRIAGNESKAGATMGVAMTHGMPTPTVKKQEEKWRKPASKERRHRQRGRVPEGQRR